MLLFGPLFGIISDRYDRRRTVVFLLAAMAALTFSVSAGLAMGQLPWQLIYPVCIFCGVANVLDTTNRPALIFDLLHAQGSSENLSNAMALRSMGAGVGGALGVWMVGVVVELSGVWLGFLCHRWRANDCGNALAMHGSLAAACTQKEQQ